jgi:hypothetical protein
LILLQDVRVVLIYFYPFCGVIFSAYANPSHAHSAFTLPPNYNPANFKRVKAIYDFEARTSSEISFKAGDVFVLISEDPSGWWVGEKDGKMGTSVRR